LYSYIIHCSKRVSKLQGFGLKHGASRPLNREIGAPELHCFAPCLHLANLSIFALALKQEELQVPGSTTNISGLQDSKVPPPSTRQNEMKYRRANSGSSF